MEWWHVAGFVLALIGSLFGIYKWGVTRLDKRRERLAETHNQVLLEHAERLDRHSARLSKLDDVIKITREDLHQNYCRLDKLERLERALDNKLDRVHQRIGALARDINSMMGAVKANHENEISRILEQIKEAVKAGGVK